MTRERWEVRGWGKALAFSTRAEAREFLGRGRASCSVPIRIVRVRTFAVVSVWAWRHHDAGARWWWCASDRRWIDKAFRTLYPTRAAALAARPSADAILVRIRRRQP